MNLSLDTRPVSGAETEVYFDPKQRPVDLAHLSRYTMGNNVIEREVLYLFQRQTRIYFDKLSCATSEDAWFEAARVIKASARSVGAWQVLRTAEAAEQMHSEPNRDELLRVLAGHIEEATLYIDSIL